VTARTPEQPVLFGAQLHVPTTVPPEKPVGLKQQSLVRRSHTPVPQVGGEYDEQAPASPPELLDEEPPLDDDELPPDDELLDDEPPLEDDELPPDDELLDDEPPLEDAELPPDDELLDDEPPLEDAELLPDDELLDDELLDDELLTVASPASSPESTDASLDEEPPRERRQYFPPRGDVVHVSPVGQSALALQSW
jgi:hypothetical protein